MNDLLSRLKQFSVIVADTGDFDSIRKYQPRDTTTNPSLLLKAAQMPEYAALVEKALADAKKESPNTSQTLGTALDRLAVAFGLEILKIVPGRLSVSMSKPASPRRARSSAVTKKPASRANASSSRSPRPGKAFAPPNNSRAKASIAI